MQIPVKNLIGSLWYTKTSKELISVTRVIENPYSGRQIFYRYVGDSTYYAYGMLEHDFLRKFGNKTLNPEVIEDFELEFSV